MLLWDACIEMFIFSDLFGEWVPFYHLRCCFSLNILFVSDNAGESCSVEKELECTVATNAVYQDKTNILFSVRGLKLCGIIYSIVVQLTWALKKLEFSASLMLK